MQIKFINLCEDVPRNDRTNLIIFSSLLFMPLFIEFITVIQHGANPIITALVYILFLFLSIFKIRKQIKYGDIYILLGLCVFFILNILLNIETIVYYKKLMLLVFVLYIPLGVVSVRHIINWNNFFVIVRPYAIISTLIAIYIVFFANVRENEEYFSYMEFSYCLLPFTAALYVISRQKKSVPEFCYFFINALCSFLYGARATTLFLIIFIILYELSTQNIVRRIFVVILIGCSSYIVAHNFSNVIWTLSEIPGIGESRLISKALAGELSDGGDRDILIQQSFRRINSMGLEIPGLFGDRKYIQGVYPHNIGLEIMMQFGWYCGISVLFYLLCLIIRGVFFSKYSVVAIYLCCVLLGKFMLSSSYVQDGSFWLWLFAIIGMRHD